MIIKILSSASQDFHGVKYNDKKMQSGDGELMEMKNFPSFINTESSQNEVRNYFKSISKGVSGKVKKPQFHAVISTRFRNHTKQELTKVANEVMKELGYGKQPYIVVFHNDTDNNHVHIVSTRVSKDTGKKINDSFEKIKAQQALSNVMEKYGIKSEKKLEDILKYKFQSINQLETLLNREGYKISVNKEDNYIDIIKNGTIQKTVDLNSLNIKSSLSAEEKKRAKQIYAIFEKYSKVYSSKVFRVEDDRELQGKRQRIEAVIGEDKNNIKIDFESELQHNLKKKFGLDIIFHNKDNKNPFGYTLIDNKTGTIYKGSEIMKMKELFQFTEEKIDKKTFEKIKEFNITSEEMKSVLLKHLKLEKKEIKDFMLFNNNKRLKLEDWKQLKTETVDYIKGGGNDKINIVQGDDGVHYVVHSKLHHIQSLNSLVGEELTEKYLNGNFVYEDKNLSNKSDENLSNEKNTFKGKGENILGNLMRGLMKSEFSKSDPDEIAKKNKRKNKRKRR